MDLLLPIKDRSITLVHPKAHFRRLSGDVPQCHLDGAHGAAPGLEGSEAADPHHHPFHVPRIFPEDVFPVEQDVRFEIGFAVLGLGIAVDALVGRDTHHRILPP